VIWNPALTCVFAQFIAVNTSYAHYYSIYWSYFLGTSAWRTTAYAVYEDICACRILGVLLYSIGTRGCVPLAITFTNPAVVIIVAGMLFTKRFIYLRRMKATCECCCWLVLKASTLPRWCGLSCSCWLVPGVPSRAITVLSVEWSWCSNIHVFLSLVFLLREACLKMQFIQCQNAENPTTFSPAATCAMMVYNIVSPVVWTDNNSIVFINGESVCLSFCLDGWRNRNCRNAMALVVVTWRARAHPVESAVRTGRGEGSGVSPFSAECVIRRSVRILRRPRRIGLRCKRSAAAANPAMLRYIWSVQF